MGRAGHKKDQGESERRCIVSGETQSKHGLIRFVITPDGLVAPDLLAKLPGRGMWVSADMATLQRACRGNIFARAARQKVVVPDDLVSGIETALTQRVITLIALARKAGHAVAGYEKVKAWLERGEAAYLVQASDGSERGKSKLRPPGGPETNISVLTGAEIGHAFGRENVIHGALATGGLTNRVVDEATRLAGLRAPVGD